MLLPSHLVPDPFRSLHFDPFCHPLLAFWIHPNIGLLRHVTTRRTERPGRVTRRRSRLRRRSVRSLPGRRRSTGAAGLSAPACSAGTASRSSGGAVEVGVNGSGLE